MRWVAVRHAGDHVHVVAPLARQDGRRVFPRNDFWRAGEASREVEAKYGLTVTAASDRTAAKRVAAVTARLHRRHATDSSYVCLARRLGAVMWTLDGALARNAADLNLPVRLLS